MDWVGRLICAVAEELLDAKSELVSVVVFAELLAPQDEVGDPSAVSTVEEVAVHVKSDMKNGIHKRERELNYCFYC